ncbi:MAG: alkyl/aryl-sulfatase, partial [Pseudomonadales bacterium]|nr:alkyl/aryl-sulfatase [Pseudomonadales bacterium]
MKDSFAPGIETVGPKDQLAHPDHLAHSERLVRKLYQVREGAWSLVGNGLSNQSFIEGPEGLIVIDTGDCREEMAAAMAEIRTRTDAPVVACIYTHFHYVGGTEVLLEASGNPDLPIWGHAGIEANLKRFGGEVGPRVSRGLVHQFGMAMPAQGPDGLVNVGLGNFYRNPDHAPFTRAYVTANNTFEAPTKARIAGLDVHFLPAPSDATDSATVWFPELGIAVNNLLWPALFNVFAIRGEEYRDPRILINGLDELLDLDATHLIAAHGPPMSGGAEIRERVQNYRDAIQFLWDQTVRHANLGYGLDEMIAHITLPEAFSAHFTTRQFYGLVEHHVRQIYTGLFGWFDENEANLFPVPLPERAARMIEGFGGIEKVRAQADAAIDAKDY